MDKNLIFSEKPHFIEDLGTGYSNVHININKISVEDFDEATQKVVFVEKWKADVQRVKNPVTYESFVNTAIKEEFPNGEDDASLRKGILDASDKDFVAFNEFVESVKKSFKTSQFDL